jgi:hypothetical protein
MKNKIYNNIIAKVLVIGLLSLLSSNLYAIPLLNKQPQITEAATANEINKEKQAEAYKKDKHIKYVEDYCLKVSSVRFGKGYQLEITDRRVPLSENEEQKYTIVGTATSDEKKLSFVCKLKRSEDNKFSLTEFKLFEVVK